MKVAILGASNNPERYSNKAQQMLMEADHEVFPISPTGKRILEVPGFRNLSEIPSGTLHTITLYLSPKHLVPIVDQIIGQSPERVIFNPGTESPEIEKQLAEEGIEVKQACTLVLLTKGQF